MERKNAWNTYGKREISELEELNSNYIDFLSDCKTERECVKETVRQAMGERLQVFRRSN